MSSFLRQAALRMETRSDNRFDPNYAIQLLVDIANEQSLEELLRKLVRRAVERADIACAQIWLIEDGDLCATCPHRRECPARSRCLHLVAGKGVSLADGNDAPEYGDRKARMPLGAGLFEKVAVSERQRIVKVIGSQRLIGFEWLEREQITGFGVTSITYKGEVMGAIIAFTRQDLPEESRPWGRIFADHVGAAIANARAFEEIQRLKAQLELQNAYLMEEVVAAKAFGVLVGQSASLRQVISQIDLVAPTEASVLILGETGTGKDLVAFEIHRRSLRKDGPMVRVNCASIPKNLFESEFFGHVKGAFTGAVKDRAGRFETAGGGTLFLDEIGEVPLEMQGKLLRVLQEKRYERVGDDRTRHADVRIIGATNRDLKKGVAEGWFREDLYYRLHVFPVLVAPLRERKDDIPLLAVHFVEISVKELRCPKPRLTRDAVARLQNYDWPGNIRELRNVIERAVILARGGTLRFDLPARDSAQVPSLSPPQQDEAGGHSYLTEAEMRLRERDNILAVLDAARWKIKGADGAAALAGIKPATLVSRIKKMGLKRPELGFANRPPAI